MKNSRILFGILTGAFLGKSICKNGRTEPCIGGIRDVVEIRHLIPGRVRFYVPSIKDKDSSKEKIAAILQNVKSIKSISVNIKTCSIVISYDVDQDITPEILTGIIIKILDLDKIIEEQKEPLISKEIGRLKEALDYSVYKQTKGALNFAVLIPLFLTSFSLKKIVFEKSNIKPNPYSMLYWAYKSFF
ncbi:MAG: hypothetical protein LKE46_04680 [Clostridium sp.]|uniref:HMA2 domain-containing protein n=1 Tax=Clostridium sp. TaxID=1506 RepID=UPI0025BC53E8|nr:hypothetical protein [Clostridium sp.]MCH3963545.1 hypothetical protein [Clostridium sp.]MCI1714686.1 hypothetical protein [Clostridium sp.]MCI1799125.1 hypothetical protein [Clostridium sp.]MCI1812869.1 hypothetical protein [Clostridium sp.]MCI1869759.1 hypothetical protein [Clostridium sp.]